MKNNLDDLSKSKRILVAIINSRYRTERTDSIEEFFAEFGYDKFNSNQIINEILNILQSPEIQFKIPQYPEYVIPSEIIDNNDRIRAVIIPQLKELKEKELTQED